MCDLSQNYYTYIFFLSYFMNYVIYNVKVKGLVLGSLQFTISCNVYETNHEHIGILLYN